MIYSHLNIEDLFTKAIKKKPEEFWAQWPASVITGTREEEMGKIVV
jgi:hypothetical protein